MPVSRCRHSDDSAPMTALPTVVFAGTPEFAAAALEALVEAGCTVPLVLTQPDRPAGRGMKLTSSAVKRVALARGIEVFQPPSLKKDLAAIERLRQTPHDVMVAAAYGLLLPRAVLDIPPLGCLNIHASLLPRWRGAAPIQRAIEAGDAVTGICIMRMEEGLDTGPVLLREEIAILPADTAATLHDRLMHTGARAIVNAVKALAALCGPGAPPTVPQAQQGVTYAAKISKDEAVLDFTQPAAQLACKLRAFDPFPGCSAQVRGVTLKLWAGEALAPAVSGDHPPGTLVQADDAGIVIACANGALRVTELQKPGGKRLHPREFLQGFALVPGERLGGG